MKGIRSEQRQKELDSALGGTMSVTEEEQDMTRPLLGLCQVEIGFNLFVMLAEALSM